MNVANLSSIPEFDNNSVDSIIKKAKDMFGVDISDFRIRMEVAHPHDLALEYHAPKMVENIMKQGRLVLKTSHPEDVEFIIS